MLNLKSIRFIFWIKKKIVLRKDLL